MPVHFAAQEGQTEILKILKKKNAALDMRCYYGWTPAHLAAYHGHMKFLKILYDKGISLCPTYGDKRTTPADLAESNGYSKCADWLRMKTQNEK